MNDPHPIYFKDTYHVFYQYSCLPDDPYGGPHRWGHAASHDLVHWQHLPVAITPRSMASARIATSGRVAWSTTAASGRRSTRSRTSTSGCPPAGDKDLATFRKYPGNPVIQGPPPGLEIEGGMRDPWVWKESDDWYLILGSGLKGGQGAVVPLYKSSDLIHWQYLHPLYQGSAGQDGGFCECPAFFPLGDKHVLLLSNQATYLVGRYENHRFLPERRGRLDYGGVYVPQSVLDGKGRRISWGWVLETRGRDAQRQAGWAGMQTLPRVLIPATRWHPGLRAAEGTCVAAKRASPVPRDPAGRRYHATCWKACRVDNWKSPPNSRRSLPAPWDSPCWLAGRKWISSLIERRGPSVAKAGSPRWIWPPASLWHYESSSMAQWSKCSPMTACALRSGSTLHNRKRFRSP